MLVSPQRSKADDLDTQIGAAEAQLTDAQQLLATPNKQATAAALKAAKRALPDTPQMSNILRQLSAPRCGVEDRARQHHSGRGRRRAVARSRSR